MSFNHYKSLSYSIDNNITENIKLYPTICDIVDIVKSIDSKTYTGVYTLPEFYEVLAKNEIMYISSDHNEYVEIIKLIFTKLCNKYEYEFIRGG